MRLPVYRTALSFTLAAVLLAGCGGSNDADDEAAGEDTTEVQEDTASASAAPAPDAPPPAGVSSSAPLAVDDIDRWQRGMDAELKAVHEAGVKLKAAKTGEDTVSAMFAANDMQTRDAGAAAAGVDGERYQFIRTTLSSAVAQLSPLEMEMKVSELPPAMVEEMKKGRETALARMSTNVPAPVIDALRPRAAALRKQDMTLAMERLRAMGQGR